MGDKWENADQYNRVWEKKKMLQKREKVNISANRLIICVIYMHNI